MTDREKVKTALDCRANDTDIDCRKCDYYIRKNKPAYCDFRGILRDAVALLKEQEWHLLTDDADGSIHGLPGDDGQYLMTDGNEIWIDDYVDGVDDGIILDSGRDIREITAWMYMPELPKQNRR